jgi:hypothetical protein
VYFRGSSISSGLPADPARPRYLINEPGVGYRLRTEPIPEG